MPQRITKTAGRRIEDAQGNVQIEPSVKTTETLAEPTINAAGQTVQNNMPIQTMTERVFRDNPNNIANLRNLDFNSQVSFTRDEFGDAVIIGNRKNVIDMKGQDFVPAEIPQMQQQQQGQMQEQKTGLQTAAEIGVTPAVFTANLISKGLKLLTGKDIGQLSVSDFANTDVGRALGIATDVAGLAAAGAGAFAALGGAEGISAGAGALRLTFPQIIKGTVAKNAAATKLLSANTLKLLGAGAVVGIPVKIQNDAKKAIASSRTSLSLILEGMKTGQLSLTDGLTAIDEIDAQINSFERSMDAWSKLSVINYLGAGKDNLVDALNAKRDVLLARQQATNIFVQQFRGQNA